MSDTTETKQAPTRRAVVAGGTALAGVALVNTLASRSYAFAADEALKVGIVGCGGRGTGALSDAFSTSGKFKLIAMGDAFKDRLDGAHGTISNHESVKGGKNVVDVPDDRKFVGFDAFKQVVDSGVDGVFLATSPGWRPYHLEYAIKQGKNVFMEKPVATDAIGVRKVLEVAKIAKEKNLKIGVGLQRHHQAVYEETIKYLQDGGIGEILYTRVYWNGNRPWVRNRQPDQTEMQYQMKNWYYFTWLCGDHINEQHIHNMDVSNWLMGSAPSFAQGAGGIQGARDKDRGEIFDHHSIEFVYGDKWDVGPRMVSMCRQIEGCWNDVSEHAYGTKAYCNLAGGIVKDYTGKVLWKSKAKGINPYEMEHEVLWDAVRNNKPHNEAEYGAMSTMTAILGRNATYSGKMIKMSDALASNMSLFPEGFPEKQLTWDTKPRSLPGADGFYPAAVPGTTQVI